MENFCALENKNSDMGVGLNQKVKKMRRLRLGLCITVLVGWAVLFFTPVGLFFRELPIVCLAMSIIGGFGVDLTNIDPGSIVLILSELMALFLVPLSIISMLIFGYHEIKHHKGVFAIETALMSLIVLALLYPIILLIFSGLARNIIGFLAVAVLLIITVSFILLLVINTRLYKNTPKPKKYGQPRSIELFPN